MSGDPGTAGSIAPWVMPFVSIVGSGIVAWFVADRVSRRTGRRQAFVDLLTMIDDLETAAESLLLVPGNGEGAHALYRTVCTSDSRLGRRLTEVFHAHPSRARLAGTDPVPAQVSNARIALRQLITDDELVTATRAAVPGNDPKFDDLRTCVDKLRRSVREEAHDLGASDL